MKIKIPFEKLKKEINKASLACMKTGQNTTLKSIFFKTEINSLVIRATNIDIGYESVVVTEVEREGEFSILGDVISRLLNTVNVKGSAICTLEYANNKLSISVDTHSFTLKTTDSTGFPKLPNVEGEEFAIDSNLFLNGMKSVVFSVAKSELKPEISGVYISLKNDSVVFVATDAYRLCERKIKIEGADFAETKCIIPEKNVKDIIRLFEEYEKKEIKVTLSKSSLLLQVDNTFLVSRLIEGNFPNYVQIIPTDPVSFAVFLKEDLVKSLKIVSFFGDKTSQINLAVETDKSIMSATSVDIGDTKEEVATTLKGEGFQIKVNSKYLEEFLQIISDQSVMLKYTAQNKAMIAQGINDSSYTYLLMPSYR